MSGTKPFVMYPPAGGKINNLAVNDPITVPVDNYALCISSGTVNFRVNVTPTNGAYSANRSVTAVFDGGGSTIAANSKAYIANIPYNANVTGWRIISPSSGSIVVDVWKSTYDTFPPTVSNTIAGSEKPTLSGAMRNEDTNLTTWTTPIASGSCLVFNVDSATSVTYAQVMLLLEEVA